MDGRSWFVEYGQDGAIQNGWKPATAGDWKDTTKDGEDRADDLLKLLAESEDAPTFARVVRDAVRADPEGKSGASAGFFFRIARALSKSKLLLALTMCCATRAAHLIATLEPMIT